MSEHRSDIILTATLFVLIGAMTYLAFDFNEQARRVPLVVGIPTTVLLGLQLLRSIAAAKTGSPALADTAQANEERPAGAAAAKEVAGPKGEAASIRKGPMKSSALEAFGWVLLLGVSFYLLGMLATVPVFFAVFMRVYAKERWRTIALSVGITLGIFHLFFVVLLEVRLYQGRFGEFLPW